MTSSKLGTDTDTGQFVYLPKAARVQGLYIVGLQGMGKSGLISNLVIEDIKQGTGVCVLDPKRDLIDTIIARLPSDREKDVILLDVADEDYPFGLNLFECPNLKSPSQVEKTVDRVIHIFDKLLGVDEHTPLISQYLLHCTHTLVANPGYTMADIELLLTDKNCRQKLVANVKKSQTRNFWHEYYDPMSLPDQRNQRIFILRRVEKFLRDMTLPIVGQSTTTIDLQTIMDDRKILLVKLDRTMEQATTLIGSMIVAMILNAAISRQTQTQRQFPQFHLYADEFQRFATEDFATLLEEARSAAIGITMAHQNRAQLEASDKRVEAHLKARTLNVGSIVVFYVPTDAEELAGQFDTTPPPAWEEELEEESVEVLEEEWFERVEEEVIDGEEEIKTPVKDVVHHLLNGGSHLNNNVNQFRHGTLAKLGTSEQWREMISIINRVLYNAMVNNQNSIEDILEVVRHICSLHQLNAFYFGLPYPASSDFFTYWTTGNTTSLYQAVRQKLEQKALNQITRELMFIDAGIPVEVSAISWGLPPKPLGQLPPLDLPKLKQIISVFHQETKAWMGEPEPTWFWIDPDQIEWAEYRSTAFSDQIGTYDWGKWQIKPGQEWKFYRPQDLSNAVYQLLLTEQQQFEVLVTELKEVMQALATPNGRIEVGSGLARPRKRKQINILTHPRQIITHPRVAIMHPQPTSAEMEKKNENQLLQLDLYQAWVKMIKNDSQNPGKECMKCGLRNANGARSCIDCNTKLPAPNEYIIKTIEPEQGLYGKVLQARIERIKENNRKPDQFGHVYCRSRQEVEAEIVQRQLDCSSSTAPAQPQQPSPLQQTPHTRQVPTCPKCGKSNPRGSQFCNQCGTKLHDY